MTRSGRSTTRQDAKKVLGLIHTVATLVPTFDELTRELGGPAGVTATHLVDEALLAVTRRDGLTPTTARHLLAYAIAAQETGADVILVTCSSIGPAVELVAPLVDVPVLRVDEAMVEGALELGSRIGVLATLESTMKPTAELVERRARAVGRKITLEVRLCAGAFDAARRGDSEAHDALVQSELRLLMGRVDAILLAQASMARALGAIDPTEVTIPVLTSPRLAIERALEVLERISTVHRSAPRPQ
jgi:Asp/Glu/hydantoin racemase